MNNISLIRQRILITEKLNAIKCLSGINNIYRDSARIARTINVLGDKLKVYISMEKKTFSPYLYTSNDIYEREVLKGLLDNRDNIVDEYEKFRKKYNTGKKISIDIDRFKKDAQGVIKLLERTLRAKNIIDIYCC